MAKKKKKVPGSSEGEVEDPRDEYLSLFVKDGKGEVKGESIGVENEKIVIKEGDVFFMFPLDSVRIEEEQLTIIKNVNWKKARKEGEKWRKRELDPLDQG